MAHLPGSICELIGDLRRNKGWSQRELAKRSGVAESTLSRIESGIAKQVDATALGKIALARDTSTDDLLGLTPIRTPKHIDMIRLGLLEEAARQPLSPAFKTEIWDRLIEHPQFPYLLRLIDVCFRGAKRTLPPDAQRPICSAAGYITHKEGVVFAKGKANQIYTVCIVCYTMVDYRFLIGCRCGRFLQQSLPMIGFLLRRKSFRERSDVSRKKAIPLHRAGCNPLAEDFFAEGL